MADEAGRGRVLVLGSLNVDLTTRVARHPSPGETVSGSGLSRRAGGKGANQAVAAAAAGARVAMAGAVGADEAGTAYRERLRTKGIDVDAVTITADQPTGHALIVVDQAGENTIVVVPGANATLTGVPAAVDTLGPGDVLLAVLEVPLDVVADAARAAHARGARVVLNLAPYADLPADVIALADPVVVNEHEARQLAAAGLDAGSLVITAGAAGARWGELQVPGHRVDVVDTTGAGDAFCGALAAALAGRGDETRGAGRQRALAAGVAAGARAVGHHGAQPDPEL